MEMFHFYVIIFSIPDVFPIEIPLGRADLDSIKIAIVYDKTAGKMLIYVNGTLVKEETVSVPLSIANAAEIKLSVDLKVQRTRRAIQQAPGTVSEFPFLVLVLA